MLLPGQPAHPRKISSKHGICPRRTRMERCRHHPLPCAMGCGIGRYCGHGRQQDCFPSRFGAANRLRVYCRQIGQHLPAQQPQSGGIHRPPGHIGKPRQPHSTICHRHCQPGVISSQHLPRRPARVRHRLQPRHRQQRLPGPELRDCQRVGIAAKIKCAHQPVQPRHAVRKIKRRQRLRPLGPRVPAPRPGQRLAHLPPCL